MLENNILKEREMALSLARMSRNLLYKFIPSDSNVTSNCCEKIEPTTILEYQKDIDVSLDETYENLKLLSEAIGE